MSRTGTNYTNMIENIRVIRLFSEISDKYIFLDQKVLHLLNLLSIDRRITDDTKRKIFRMRFIW